MNLEIQRLLNALRSLIQDASRKDVPVYAILLAVDKVKAELEALTAQAMQREASLEAKADGEAVTEANDG